MIIATLQNKLDQYTLENTKGTFKKGKSKETGKIGYTRRRNTTQKHNSTICGCTPLYASKHN